jgi:hypothetical protein
MKEIQGKMCGSLLCSQCHWFIQKWSHLPVSCYP